MSRLEERVERLEDILQDILGGQPDQLQSNVLTVQPDGTVSATFTGHIVATGLDLTESPNSTPASLNLVDWLDASSTVRERIYGAASTPNHELVAQSTADAFNTAQLGIYSSENGGTGAGSAGLLAIASDFFGGSPSSAQVTLIDSLSRSDFVQIDDPRLGGPQQVLLMLGSDTLVWPGGSSTSNTKRITTVEARSAARIWLTAAQLQGGFFPVQPAFGSQIVPGTVPGLAQVDVNCNVGGTPGAGSTLAFHWLAIGT